MSATQSSFSSDRPLLGRARLILKGIHFAGVLLLGVVLLPSVALLGRHAKHLINWWLGRMLAALAVDVAQGWGAPVRSRVTFNRKQRTPSCPAQRMVSLGVSGRLLSL